MPEFPGYTGEAAQELPVIKVKAITHRKNPIMQTCIGPSEEHVNMAGIPTEASIIQMIEKAMPGRLLNVYAHSAGGGNTWRCFNLKRVCQVIKDENAKLLFSLCRPSQNLNTSF